MTVTSQLLELFRVDKQLRGLRTRLDAAERFLREQTRQAEELKTGAAAIEAQIRQLRAAASNAEGEVARLDAKINALREQMNAAKTAKEYNALLTELGNYKDERSAAEEQALAALSKIEELDSRLKEIAGQQAERMKIVAAAETERASREAEIKDRLDELTARRASLAGGIPKDALSTLEHLIRTKGDDAMAHVEVIDRRNYEYSCAACYMTLPMETVSSIVTGKLTHCVNCGSILFTEDTEIVKSSSKQVQKA